MKLFVFTLLISLGLKAQHSIVSPTTINTVTEEEQSSLELGRGGGNSIISGSRANGSESSPTFLTAGDKMLSLDGLGYSNGIFTKSSEIGFLSSSTWSSTNRGSSIIFRTRSNSSTLLVDRATVNHKGWLGVGTTSPLFPLHVVNGLSNNPNLGKLTALVESNNDTYLNMHSYFLNYIYFLKGKFSSKYFKIWAGYRSFQFSSNGQSFFSLHNHLNKPILSIGNSNRYYTTLSIHGDFQLSFARRIATSDIQAHNNYSRNRSSLMVVSGGGIKSLSGITDGKDGLIFYISIREGTFLNIQNENSNSLPQNRIITDNGLDMVISNNGGATLIYDGDSQRWRVIGKAL
ncbi:MAG: hypothetical protein ACRCVT_09055 [Leadbetterella sp.]